MLLQWNPDFSNLTKKCLEKSGAQLPNIQYTITVKRNVFWLEESEGLGNRGFETLEFHRKSVYGKDLHICGSKLEQKYADLGLSYNCLFLILSSYVYELNFAQVSFFRHIFIQYMMGTQNFLVFISFC